MGQVIDIRRSTDDDIFEAFQVVCPDVPAQINEAVHNVAARAIGGRKPNHNAPSLKMLCLVLAVACLAGMLLVRGVTARWNNALEAVAYPSEEIQFNAATSGGDLSFRRSKEEWAEYISKLESDPYYQYVQEEKRRFSKQYLEKGY